MSDQTQDPNDLIDEAEESLRECVKTLKALRKAAPSLEPVLRVYTLGNLEAFLEERQPGSISDLRDRLEEDECDA